MSLNDTLAMKPNLSDPVSEDPNFTDLIKMVGYFNMNCQYIKFSYFYLLMIKVDFYNFWKLEFFFLLIVLGSRVDADFKRF